MSVEVMDMAKLIQIPTFRAEDGRVLQFFPVTDKIMAQTSTHRVVLNGKAIDWLSASFRPNKKAAVFFLGKHEQVAL